MCLQRPQPLERDRREIRDEMRCPAIGALQEGDPVVAVRVAEDERRDRHPAFRVGAHPVRPKAPVRQRRHRDPPDEPGQLRDRPVGHADGAIAARERAGRFAPGAGCGRQRGPLGEVPIDERLDERRARRRAAVRIARHEEAYLLVGQQRQLRVEPQRVAAMAVDPSAVAVHLVEAVQHAVQRGHVAEQPAVHPARGRLGQDPRLAVRAVLEVSQHEARHVHGARAHRAGRRIGHELELLRLVFPVGEPVAHCHVGLEGLRQRLAGRGVRHPQRLENLLLDVLLVWDARDAFDDVAGEGGAVVGVGGEHARWPHASGHLVGEQLAERPHRRLRAAEQPDHHVLEPWRVRQQVRHRYRLRVSVRHAHRRAGEVLVDVGLQVELPLVHELHHRRPREQLRDRSDTEECPLRIHLLPGGAVGHAVALGEEDPPLGDHGHRHARDVVRLLLRGDHPVEEGLELGWVLEAAGRGGRRRRALRRPGKRRRLLWSLRGKHAARHRGENDQQGKTKDASRHELPPGRRPSRRGRRARILCSTGGEDKEPELRRAGGAGSAVPRVPCVRVPECGRATTGRQLP